MTNTNLPDLTPVINWLENGCDPKEAAKELRLHQQAIAILREQQPTQKSTKPLIADRLFIAIDAECELDSAMCDFGLGHYVSSHVDPYDDSIEFHECPVDMCLSEDAKKWLFSQGFLNVWLRHVDGMETYYCHTKDGIVEAPKKRGHWAESQQPTPIDMILHCPSCGLQHIDAPDERTPDWKNEPHRSHLCHGCGCIWRPADVPTNGVAEIKTSGKNDSRRFSRNAQPAQAAVAVGYKLVPEKLTHDMAKAFFDCIPTYEFWEVENPQDVGKAKLYMLPQVFEECYSAMLNAAPDSKKVNSMTDHEKIKPSQHSDNIAVDRFAEAMKIKLAQKRDEGRRGWDDESLCEMKSLAEMLIDHVPKGDPIDIANFCMMLHQREQMAVEHHPCHAGSAIRYIREASIQAAECEHIAPMTAEDRSKQKTDWCPRCGQGWQCAEREQANRISSSGQVVPEEYMRHHIGPVMAHQVLMTLRECSKHIQYWWRQYGSQELPPAHSPQLVEEIDELVRSIAEDFGDTPSQHIEGDAP